MAFGSPVAALLTSCLATAFRFVIFLRMPFSVIGTRVFSSAWISVAKFLTPLPRPFGLPD